MQSCWKAIEPIYTAWLWHWCLCQSCAAGSRKCDIMHSITMDSSLIHGYSGVQVYFSSFIVRLACCGVGLPRHMTFVSMPSQAGHGILAGKVDDFLLQLEDIAILAALRFQEPAPLLELGLWPLSLQLLGDFDAPARMQQNCQLLQSLA